ncbi:MAG: glucarate dehydratase [Hamadaea sp.]|uniref:glucarate dehydratase family protein n=1 Tax=Hamadaea sp. TaxID=2024425 RepID=UPI00185A63BF|nr:glucarate dehydratase family protein [Hamadaea sp.]NUR73676.1 glucarate dehydratase [Hamadaea sp.]NUT20391.1 glucarate dehydratase [Hamadaea sp.]
MKIRDVRITPIAFPDPPLLNAAGVHQPWALRTIVEVDCGDGFVGLGETYGDAPHLTLMRAVAPHLVGEDVFATTKIQRRIQALVGERDAPDLHGLTGRSSPEKTVSRVFSPIEVACLDLQGQATGRPVHDLLGGAVRDAVPFSAYLFYKYAAHPGQDEDPFGEALTPEQIVSQARTMVEQYGFRSIKLKGGVFPPDEELAAVKALREAFPDHPLRIDPNAVWSVETSQRIAAEADGLLEYLEDPTPGRVGMAEVAKTAAMPLATNMCVVAFEHLPEAVELGSVRVILSDHHYWGGLRQSARLAGVCQTWGIGLSMHSNSHLGISLAAMTHLGAALPELSYAADTHTPWQLGVDVVEQPLRFVDGAVQVPTTPGLGVTLDRDALARMHEDYLRCGVTERDDTTYMQKTFRPEFRNNSPRW